MNVAVYVRTSSYDIRSIENQIQLITEYINKHGFTIYKLYSDIGYSGSSLNRPKFNNLIKDMKLGLFDCIITKDLSRLGRNLLEVGRFIEEEIVKYNIRYIAISDSIDSFEYDDVSFVIRSFLNDYYIKEYRRKSLSLIKAKASKKIITGTVKYGYKMIDKEIEIDFESSNVVKAIFKMFLNNYNYKEIAAKLNNEQVLTPSQYKKRLNEKLDIDNKWNSVNVSRILKDIEYCGHGCNLTYCHSKNKVIRNYSPIIVKDTHPAIISEDDYNLVQTKINSKKPQQKKNYLYSKMIKCGKCLKNLSVDVKYNNNYRCRSCNTKISEAIITKIISADLLFQLDNDDVVMKYFNSNNTNVKRTRALIEKNQMIKHNQKQPVSKAQIIDYCKSGNLREMVKQIEIYENSKSGYCIKITYNFSNAMPLKKVKQGPHK